MTAQGEIAADGDTVATLQQWHNELSGALRVLHDRGQFRADWHRHILQQAGTFLWLPFMLLVNEGWYILGALLAGAIAALLVHGRWLMQYVRDKVEVSGQVEALLVGDPELLERYATLAVSEPSLSSRLAQIADHARSQARIPALVWLNIALWLGVAGAVVLFAVDQQVFQQPVPLVLALAGVGLLGGTSSLLLLIGETARQHFLLRLSEGVARGLGIPLDKLLAPHKPPVERIAKRLGVTSDVELVTALLVAALFLGALVAPLVWVAASFDYTPAFSLLHPLLLIPLNILGGVLCLSEAAGYRRDVRAQLAQSDLPLRIALGQVEPARHPVLTLAKDRAELERAAQAAAARLPAEIGLRTQRMRGGLAFAYYGLATPALLLIAVAAWPYSEDLTLVFGLFFAALPLLIFPLFAYGYKRSIHAEELVRLLRERQAS